MGLPGLTVRQAVNVTTITVGLVRLTAALNVPTLALLKAAAALRTLLVAKLAPLAIVFNFGQRPTVDRILVLVTFRINVAFRVVPFLVLSLKL